MIELVCENNKILMNHILKLDTFNDFLLVKFFIDTDISYRIHGEQKRKENTYIKWHRIKPKVFELIKTSEKPSNLDIIFTVDDTAKSKIAGESIELINGFILIMTYDGKQTKIKTGVNYKMFTLDKTTEKKFDEMIIKFFDLNQIPYSKC